MACDAPIIPTESRKCSIHSCGRNLRRRGFCESHYRRYRAGNLAAPIVAFRLPLADRLWPKVSVGHPDECWPWIARAKISGYGVLTSPAGNVLAHRVAWQTTNGPIPDGLWVLHRCDNPPCCNPGHLFLGTAQDNIDDMMRKGRAPSRPSVGWFTKLSMEDVLSIIGLLREGRSSLSIAKAYGVSAGAIRLIRDQKTWKHVSRTVPCPSATV